MASIRKRGDRYQVRWKRLDGTQTSWTTSRKKAAEAIRRQVEQCHDLGREWSPEAVAVRSVSTLDVIAEAYMDAMEATTAPNTVKRKTQMVGLLLRWLHERGTMTAQALTVSMLHEYHVALLNPQTGRHLHGRSPETARKHIAEIQVFWKWAFENSERFVGDIPYPRTIKIRKTPPKAHPAPSWAHMDACIASANGWVRQAAVIMRMTGLRVDHQVMQLRWDDVDFASQVLRIRPELGKTSAEKVGRWVPMSPHLVTELAGWGRREGYLIECPRGVRKVRARDMRRAWTRAQVPAQFFDFAPNHCFRAGFKTGLRRAGVEKDTRDYLVGHSRGIDAHYIDPDSLELREAVAAVPPLGRVLTLAGNGHGQNVDAATVSRGGESG